MWVTSRPSPSSTLVGFQTLIGSSDHSGWLNLRPSQSGAIGAHTESCVRGSAREAGTGPKEARIGKGEYRWYYRADGGLVDTGRLV